MRRREVASLRHPQPQSWLEGDVQAENQHTVIVFRAHGLDPSPPVLRDPCKLFCTIYVSLCCSAIILLYYTTGPYTCSRDCLQHIFPCEACGLAAF